MGLFSVQGHTVQQYGALGGHVHAGEQVEHRGFTGAVGADEAHQLSGVHLDVEVLDGVEAAEGNAQMLRLQDRCFHLSHGSFPPSGRPCLPRGM